MKPIVSAALLVLASSAALAADLPARSAPPVYAPPMAPPVFTWTGFYLGANAGADINAGSAARIIGNTPGANLATLDGERPGYGHIRHDGFTGGGQIGYNYQLGRSGFGGVLGGGLVVGVEADAAYTDVHGTANYFSDRESDFASRTDFVGTVRGRVGYPFNNVLVYGTGGFAYGGADNSSSFLNPIGVQIYHGNSSTIRTGYAYGGGVEFAIPTQSFVNLFHAGAVTVKAEFIRYELGSTAYTIASNAGLNAGYTQRVRNTGDLVRAGINYKFDMFGTPAAVPVVARY